MCAKTIYLGSNKLHHSEKGVTGNFVEIENEKFYKISNVNEMPDFFMTIVSRWDHWMYLSSNGSLTAGRKNRDHALFPYYTVDKIDDYRDKTGSKTFYLVEKDGGYCIWEPFTVEAESVYSIERNLYKSIYGNKIIFEEVNRDLALSFRYGWYNSEKFGWIKKSSLQNLGKGNRKIEILDGLLNLMPYGVGFAFQSEYSNLLDAYKKNELLTESQLGLFMLSSIPVDRAEPSEALKTTTVWSWAPGLDCKILISENQVKQFINGLSVETETDVRAARGAYFVNARINLGENGRQIWYFAADIDQDARDVANLHHFIKTAPNIEAEIENDILAGTEELKKIVGSSDGIQMGKEELPVARHFANTLFNVMRGGVFTDNYTVDLPDLKKYLEQTNRTLAVKIEPVLKKLPDKMLYSATINWAEMQNNPDLERICMEYLPLTFSRRHGDPSRPWNQFSIDLKNSDGTKKLNFQGNWRDIFQNWEALSLSYPGFLEGMIAKFLNASTPDGYNPYRITREGIDWESPDPHDPWAYIGYWGDHQIIYLQKFLEQHEAFFPGRIQNLLTRDLFVYANVPYRIKVFEDIVENPKDTILFDYDLNEQLKVLFNETGADGKLLRNSQGQIVRANLAEKILVSLLAKLSNFIPEAGIWLNTQRPEWNDANNALVGNGASMVTLYYLRRFLVYWKDKFGSFSQESLPIAVEIKTHFEKIFGTFKKYQPLLSSGFSDEQKYSVARDLGNAGSEFRQTIYQHVFSGQRSDILASSLNEFCEMAISYIDQSIRVNKRPDGLYHAYNLISFSGSTISIRNLYEMLEGQVAVLSSGYLSVGESLEVLNALKTSKMFREDQFSYLLYPDRQLPRFTEKNTIPAVKIDEIELLQKLSTDQKAGIVYRDVNGAFHFDGSFRNAMVLKDALEQLDADLYQKLVERDMGRLLELYEEMFDHQSFTGRSGTFFGYEGLGSIYWHMVSKLLLATQESFFRGIEEKAEDQVLNKIKDNYYEIKAGIGSYKSPKVYGAFPTDAYSHTPANKGAKQPGLTGQVKEDVISRIFELGIQLKDGQIHFNVSLLNKNEILQKPDVFIFYDLDGNEQRILLKENQLGFTYCQVPFIYHFGKQKKSIITLKGGETQEIDGLYLPNEISLKIFNRTGEIVKIDCHVLID